MEKGTRRALIGALLALAVAAILLAVIGAIAAPTHVQGILVTAVILLVLALAGELFLLVWGEEKDIDEDGHWYQWEKEADAQEILLRCTSCKQTFPVLDTGERPLRTKCPHCGRTGQLKDEPSAAKPSP